MAREGGFGRAEVFEARELGPGLGEASVKWTLRFDEGSSRLPT